jgi:hypothetical protein
MKNPCFLSESRVLADYPDPGMPESLRLAAHLRSASAYSAPASAIHQTDELQAVSFSRLEMMVASFSMIV